MVKTKVFVGNLSFKTLESELASEFGNAGTVISANIITRGPRSLGYGFVEMESEEAANEAVKLMNKKDIGGRPINVEVAKPSTKEEGAEGQQQQQQGGNTDASRPPRRGGRGGRGGLRGTRGGRGSGRGGRGGNVNNGNNANATQNTQNNQTQPNQKFVKKAFFKGEQSEDGQEEEGADGSSGRRRRRAVGGRRRTATNENREESKTTLFVANLPFTMEDDAFNKLFSEISLAPKQAHVVTKKNGRSKGYGFVEFNSEADQQKALKEINNKQVDGRELSVKVALTDNRTEEEKAQAAAPAVSSPAVTKQTQSPAQGQKQGTPKTEEKKAETKQ